MNARWYHASNEPAEVYTTHFDWCGGIPNALRSLADMLDADEDLMFLSAYNCEFEDPLLQVVLTRYTRDAAAAPRTDDKGAGPRQDNEEKL